MIKQKPDMQSYQQGHQNLAVLLEGSFKSNYKNRIKPCVLSGTKDDSHPTKMVVIADGEVIKNGIRKGQPLALGVDPYLNLKYGNKEFLLNTVNYLLDDSGLIGIRGKEINIPFLDMEKVSTQKGLWQTITLLIPLAILGIFGFLFMRIRKKKYQRSLIA